MTSASNTKPRDWANSPAARKREQLLSAIGRLATIKAPSAERRMALAEAYFRLAILPDTDLADAIELVYKAIAYDTFHPKFFFHLGRLQSLNGNPRGAVLEYWQALKLAPGNHRTVIHLALALLDLGEDEKKIGRELIDLLSRGEAYKLGESLKKLDVFIDAYRSGTEVKKAMAEAQKKDKPSGGADDKPKAKAAADGDAKPAATPCRWIGVWRVALIDHLLGTKLQAKQVDKHLAEGAKPVEGQVRVAEYATACLMLMLAGETPKVIGQMLKGPELRAHGEHPAVQLLQRVVTLAESENPEPFIEHATQALAEDGLPVEMVCVLHYWLYGPDSTNPLPLIEMLRLLDSYPAAIQQSDSFRELRLAILDGYARLAWREERFDEARVLWRETILLDPHRVAVAHNLALLTARTKSRDDYAVAWDRAAELRYLHAAAAGDLEVMLEDRRVLHLSFAQQARQHYCAASRSPNHEPKDEELQKWMADREALNVWLKEWDLYYLNSRLRFRSPTHLLGVARDATPTMLIEARDALLEQIKSCFGQRRWAGIKTFCDLAEKLVTTAFERASDSVVRARDPYYEPEKQEADTLSGEAIDRGFLLNRMLRLLGEKSAAHNIPAACRIARPLFGLPWKILYPICINRGMDRDLDVVKIFVNNLLGVVLDEEAEPRTNRELAEALAALDECIQVLPQSVELRLGRCRLLLPAKKYFEAYTTAVEALPLVANLKDEEAAQKIEQHLVNIIESAAMEELPEHVRQPNSIEAVKGTVREGRRVLERFPRAIGLRISLIGLMIQIGDPPHIEAAIKLSEEGLELAFNQKQREELKKQLKEARSKSKTAPVMQEIKTLLEDASRRVNEVVQAIQEQPSLEAFENAKTVVASAIGDAKRAKNLAHKAKLNEAGQQADSLIADLEQVQARLQQ